MLVFINRLVGLRAHSLRVGLLFCRVNDPFTPIRSNDGNAVTNPNTAIDGILTTKETI